MSTGTSTEREIADLTTGIEIDRHGLTCIDVKQDNCLLLMNLYLIISDASVHPSIRDGSTYFEAATILHTQNIECTGFLLRSSPLG